MPSKLMNQKKELKRKDMLSRAFCETCIDTETSIVLYFKALANTCQEENQNELTHILQNKSMKHIHTSFTNAITSSVKPNGHLNW